MKQLKNYCLLLLTLFTANIVNAKCVFEKQIEIIELNIGNVLTWNTIQEESNAKFVVQKSSDGINFKTIGEVKGGGTTSDRQEYRFLDAAIGENKFFYRIGYFDKLQPVYSPSIFVSRNTNNSFEVTAMSSCITDGLFNFTIRNATEQNLTFEVRPISDEKTLKTGTIPMVKGVNLISISLEEYENGDYTIYLSANKEMESLTLKKVNSTEVPRILYVVKE